jgi:phage terminase large subunit
MDTSKGQRRIKELCNKQFYEAVNSQKRLRIFQGGTRSGKSWSLQQYCLYLMTITKDPITISIVRKTLPALKRSVIRDFLHISKNLGIYWQGVHNRSENIFEYNGHTLEFFSADDAQKIRGSARDILWLNEGNELLYEDFRQLAMRTRGHILIDFNPSDPIHWIYDLMDRNDADTFISTYKDNKFLPEELINEIERIKEKDPDYWRVYGEGQRAVFSQRQIFMNWEYIPWSEFPEFDDTIVGIDFGYSQDVAAVCEVGKVGDNLFVHEWLYKKGMTNRDLAEFLKDNNLNEKLTFCDSAEPKSIEELKQMNVWAKPSIKGQGSVNAGISLLKEFDIIVSNESINFRKEQQSYLWEELKDGTIINKPVDKMNHLMDSLRYCVYSKYKNRNDFFVV